MPYILHNQKKVYYKISGQGEPLLLIHGNTASSRMFSGIRKMYSGNYQIILVDLPGHGKSERLKAFNTDFWCYNSELCYALIKELGFNQVSVLGTSGGALIAINLAMQHPEIVKSVIADSFEGEYPLPSYIESIKADREKDKKKFFAKLFWFYCHGFGWKKIVDQDTEVNLNFSRTGKSFFHQSISSLSVPTLLTGSMKDEYCNHLDQIYDGMKKKNPALEIHLFESGNHPAMLSNKADFFELAEKWMKS